MSSVLKGLICHVVLSSQETFLFMEILKRSYENVTKISKDALSLLVVVSTSWTPTGGGAGKCAHGRETSCL